MVPGVLIRCYKNSDNFGSTIYEAVMLDLKNARSLTQALGFWQRTLLQLRFDLSFI